MSIKDKLKDVLTNLTGRGFIESDVAEVVDDNLDRVTAIVEDVHEALEDGLQWNDLRTLAGVVHDLYELAEEMEGMSNPEKAKFVENAVFVVYKFYDPDIPGVPEFAGLEDRLEAAVIPKAAHFALEAVIAVVNKLRDRD